MLKKHTLILVVVLGLLLIVIGVQFVKKKGNQSMRDEIKSRWYAEQLKALGEPDFETFKNSAEEEAYRFIWLRTFHNPVAVRVVVKKSNQSVLYLKVTNGAGGYEPGEIIKEKEIELGGNQIDDLRRIVKSNKFWEEKQFDEIGLDGAQWIVEVKCGGDYHYVDEWSPKGGSVRNIGLYLLEMGGYKPEDIY